MFVAVVPVVVTYIPCPAHWYDKDIFEGSLSYLSLLAYLEVICSADNYKKISGLEAMVALK